MTDPAAPRTRMRAISTPDRRPRACLWLHQRLRPASLTGLISRAPAHTRPRDQPSDASARPRPLARPPREGAADARLPRRARARRRALRRRRRDLQDRRGGRVAARDVARRARTGPRVLLGGPRARPPRPRRGLRGARRGSDRRHATGDGGTRVVLRLGCRRAALRRRDDGRREHRVRGRDPVRHRLSRRARRRDRRGAAAAALGERADRPHVLDLRLPRPAGAADDRGDRRADRPLVRWRRLVRAGLGGLRHDPDRDRAARLLCRGRAAPRGRRAGDGGGVPPDRRRRAPQQLALRPRGRDPRARGGRRDRDRRIRRALVRTPAARIRRRVPDVDRVRRQQEAPRGRARRGRRRRCEAREARRAQVGWCRSMEAGDPTGRTVSLVVPAKPDYVVLARLALSAVCRLSPLAPEEVADLKLAITEASNWLMGGERRQTARDNGEGDGHLTFKFDLTDDSLELCVGGDEMPTVSEEERELSMALIQATVDSYEYGDGMMRLTKQLVFEPQ